MIHIDIYKPRQKEGNIITIKFHRMHTARLRDIKMTIWRGITQTPYIKVKDVAASEGGMP